MTKVGMQQELLYQLQAVVVHRGRVDSGHYFTYARTPAAASSSSWCCLNDASAVLCSTEEMRRVCEGGTEDEEGTPHDCARAGTRTHVNQFVLVTFKDLVLAA